MNKIKIKERYLRINPSDDTRLEYFHEEANKWMDDGGVPGHVDDLGAEGHYVVMYMKDGKVFKKDIYGGPSIEVKQKKVEEEDDSSAKEEKKGGGFLGAVGGLLFGGKKKEKSSTGGYAPIDMDRPTGGFVPMPEAQPLSTKKSRSVLGTIVSVIVWIILLPFKILKFLWKLL